MTERNSYETHITLCVDSANIDRAATWAEAKGLKWTHIELASGAVLSQPMVTFWGAGDVARHLEWALETGVEIRALGFEVARIKIEAAVGNCDVPQDSETASDGLYFEHHVKVILSDDRLGSLTTIANRHQSRLSRNARRQRADGRCERFVTQRVYGVGRRVASAKLNPLLAALNDARFEIAEVEQEYVLYDSNMSLDRGWMDVKGDI